MATHLRLLFNKYDVKYTIFVIVLRENRQFGTSIQCYVHCMLCNVIHFVFTKYNAHYIICVLATDSNFLLRKLIFLSYHIINYTTSPSGLYFQNRSHPLLGYKRATQLSLL